MMATKRTSKGAKRRGRRIPPPTGSQASYNRGYALTMMTIRSILLDRKTWVLIALLLLLLGIPMRWLMDAPSDKDAEMEVFMTIMIIVYLQFIVLYTCLLYASSLVSAETEERTMTYLISRPIARSEILIYKYIGYVVSVFSIFALTTILNYIVLAPHGGSAAFTRNLDLLGYTLGGILIAVIGWGALFILMASVFKNPLMPGFLYSLFWESLLANMGGNISRATITYQIRTFIFNGPSRLEDMAQGDLPVHGGHTPAMAFLVTLIAAAAFLIMSWLFVRKRDFN